MAYDPDAIVRRLRRHLRADPGATRSAAARVLQIHRHTLNGGLAAASTSFESLRTEARLQILERFEAEPQVRSHKEMAAALGFATVRSFRDWMDRLQPAVRDQPPPAGVRRQRREFAKG